MRQKRIIVGLVVIYVGSISFGIVTFSLVPLRNQKVEVFIGNHMGMHYKIIGKCNFMHLIKNFSLLIPSPRTLISICLINLRRYKS